MSKTTCIILGACLLLQAPLSLSQNSVDVESATPIYHHEHSKELLDDNGLPENLDADEYASYIERRMRELLPAPFRPGATRVASSLIDTANRYKMDPLFLMAVVRHESKFNPEALGAHGEIGLMQIKPTTAQWLLKKQRGTEMSLEEVAKLLKDPVANIEIGSYYMSYLRSKYQGRSRYYLAAYNMGVARLNAKVKEGTEPQIYRGKVMAEYVQLLGDITPVKGDRQIAATRTFDL